MTTSKYWTPITIFLVAIIVVGGIVVWSRYGQGQPVEISIPQSQELEGEIYGGVGEEQEPQKININRAEAWLLEALPGVGEIRAQAIVDYRREKGLFHNVNELTKVEGIGITTYEKIKDLITVAD